MTNPVIILFNLLLLIHATALFSGEPIQIATSNSYDATAFNNGRRMVRDYQDRRVVVYQDSIQNQPAVMLTFSDDGINWQTPIFIDNGFHPAIAIGPDEMIYVAWASADQTELKYLEIPSKNLHQLKEKTCIGTWPLENVSDIDFPSIEVGNDFIHLVWQMKTPENPYSQIYYSSRNCDPNGKNFAGIKTLISDETTISRYPTIASDLEYEPGLVHILWTDFDEKNKNSHIVCFSAHLSDSSEYNLYDSLEKYPPEVLPNSQDCAYPSISVRNFSRYDPYSIAVMASADNQNQKLMTAILYLGLDESPVVEQTESIFNIDYLSAPCADDALLYIRSCAIIWQNSGNIYYGQTEDANIITLPPEFVNSENMNANCYPGVCYKTFRADSLDVVWTQGLVPPYKIMYRRMAKLYPHEPDVKIISTNLPDGIYKKSYAKRIDTNVDCNLEIINGVLPPGITLDYASVWEYQKILLGIPAKSGEFRFTVRAWTGGRPGWDFPLRQDSADFVIKIRNSAPKITSPAAIHIGPGEKVNYQARAGDAEGNPVEYRFKNYPKWLTPQNSKISGVSGNTKIDTSFLVIATDGDMADTLQVSIIISGYDAVSEKHEPAADFPRNFCLYQNFPNPFNAQTTIRYALPKSADIKFSIYNIKGEAVETRFITAQPAGIHSFTWECTSLSSGTYFIKMEAGGGFVDYKKCVYIR